MLTKNFHIYSEKFEGDDSNKYPKVKDHCH